MTGYRVRMTRDNDCQQLPDTYPTIVQAQLAADWMYGSSIDWNDPSAWGDADHGPTWVDAPDAAGSVGYAMGPWYQPHQFTIDRVTGV